MVDRVGNGAGYDYSRVNEKKVNTNTTGAGEKFQLDYGKEGAVYEPGSEALKRQQAEKNTAGVKEKNKSDEDGVRLTLSSAIPEQEKRVENTGNDTGKGILNSVTDIVNGILQKIKAFFLSIWNDEAKPVEGTQESVVSEAGKTEKPKTKFEEAKREAEVFLASTEGKKVARNSDLLTYYDKHGTVVSVSPSDRQRILYGDKNQIEV